MILASFGWILVRSRCVPDSIAGNPRQFVNAGGGLMAQAFDSSEKNE
jgi:hypothetical protein